MKKIIAFLLFLCSLLGFAFVEQDIKIYSKSMRKDIPVTVILPKGYSAGKSYNTIYVLHGWSGNNKNYPEKTSIGKLADQYNIIYVSPDGNYDSWYIDSPMGGFGAFYIGSKNQDVFGNIGSMSGGMNPEQYKGNWGIEKVLNSDWKEYNIKDISHQLIGTKSNIIIDCGVDDFFIEPNRELHKKLLELNIKHEYTERPGAHTWEYWDNSIKSQTYFFNQMFNRK